MGRAQNGCASGDWQHLEAMLQSECWHEHPGEKKFRIQVSVVTKFICRTVLFRDVKTREVIMLGQLKCGKAHFHVGGSWLSQVKKISLLPAFYLKEKYAFLLLFFFFFSEDYMKEELLSTERNVLQSIANTLFCL